MWASASTNGRKHQSKLARFFSPPHFLLSTVAQLYNFPPNFSFHFHFHFHFKWNHYCAIALLTVCIVVSVDLPISRSLCLYDIFTLIWCYFQLMPFYAANQNAHQRKPRDINNSFVGNPVEFMLFEVDVVLWANLLFVFSIEYIPAAINAACYFCVHCCCYFGVVQTKKKKLKITATQQIHSNKRKSARQTERKRD